ncbi:MAG: SpoIID/LytB domain-containing protein [Betaproteobacteria bacterium]
MKARSTLLRSVYVAVALLALSIEPPAIAERTASTERRDGVQIRVGFLRPDGGYRIEALPLERYVARVLAGEAARGSGPAALEALAITVRTFALANLGRHRADGFDLCDQTHCQVVRTATAATEHAAAATAGEVLLYDGAPASIYYTASCGGRTEIPSAVWPGADDPPYLPSREDDACGGAPEWSAELSARDLQRALTRAGFDGRRLRDVQVVGRDASGRVAQLRLEGLTPDVVSGQDLRVAVGRTLGWLLIRSTAFEVRRRGDRYRFTGHGSGHGVGLCVIGSARLAADGESAAQILGRYFPGLEIASAAGDGFEAVPHAPSTRESPKAVPHGRLDASILVVLPDADEGERGVVTSLVARARDDLARTLGVEAPPRVTVRFHATADGYERSTGRPWFTAGAIVNQELHMPPLMALRDRGVLERAVRQDLVRLMTGRALADRPMWVREGAAVYFADTAADRTALDAPGSPFVRPQPRRSCPSDLELTSPVSIGALSNTYARARACFEQALERAKDWRRIK